MRVYYYYYRNENRAPIITVCLIKDGDNVARGVTIRSPLDILRKSEGRRWARKYAKRALGTKTSSEPIGRQEVLEIVATALDPEMNHVIRTKDAHIFDFKSVYNPQLTAFEKRLIRIKKHE